MRSTCTNIYKTARKNAGLTQELAAELLYVSQRSMADYECGKTIPPDDVVCGMIDIYGTPWLGYLHIRNSSKVGQSCLPELNVSDLPESVLQLQKETRDLDIVKNDMIDVACDGKIDDSEVNKWQQVAKEINEMAAAAFAVLYASQKEKAPIRTLN